MRLFALLVPVVVFALNSVACSGADPEPISDDNTGEAQSQLVDEGHECSAVNKCKPGLVCVARVAGGDVGIKGVPCGGPGCGTSTSSSGDPTTSSSTSSSGWSSSSSGDQGGSTTSSSGWSSSSSSGSNSSSGWSSSSSSGSSGSNSSSGWSGSSSSGATPQVGVCITIH